MLLSNPTKIWIMQKKMVVVGSKAPRSRLYCIRFAIPNHFPYQSTKVDI